LLRDLEIVLGGLVQITNQLGCFNAFPGEQTRAYQDALIKNLELFVQEGIETLIESFLNFQESSFLPIRHQIRQLLSDATSHLVDLNLPDKHSRLPLNFDLQVLMDLQTLKQNRLQVFGQKSEAKFSIIV
jgi:hypothetical protein